ncbi:MAG: hypothetical protein Q9228_003006 [Teloschistes exilis]
MIKYAHVRFPLRTTSVIVKDHWALNKAHQHLSRADLEQLYQDPFDVEWLQKYRIDPSVLKTFTAKHKMENILLHSALVPGDAFCIFDREQKEWPAPRMALITAVPAVGRKFPSLLLYSTGPAGPIHMQVDVCEGPLDLFFHFNDTQPQKQIQAGRSAWASIRIWVPETDAEDDDAEEEEET